jgi:hypothetical protein
VYLRKNATVVNDKYSTEDVNVKQGNLTLPRDALGMPVTFFIRRYLGILGHVASAVSMALLVSMGVVYVATILFPALPFVALTLAVGCIFTVFYLYRYLKDEWKSAKQEVAKYDEVNAIKQKILEQQKSSLEVVADLSKHNAVLLKELIEEYLLYIASLGGVKALGANGKYPKQEKFFNLLEDTTRVSRNLNADGKFLFQGDDQFYNRIARYFKKNNMKTDEANALVQKLKTLFYNPTSLDPAFTQAPVNLDDPAITKSRLKKVGLFLLDNIYHIVGIATIAVLVPLFLLGGPTIICAVGAIIAVGFILTKLMTRRSEKSIKALDHEETKCALIDRKYRFQSHNEKFQSRNRSEVELNDVDPISPSKAPKLIKQPGKQPILTKLTQENGATGEFWQQRIQKSPTVETVPGLEGQHSLTGAVH